MGKAKARPTEAEEAPFFTAEPPPPVARGLAWLLLSLFATAVVLAALMRVPETVSCPFVLVPLRGADPVRAPRGGVVTAVNATESAAVVKGAPLFALRSPEHGDRSSELKSLEVQLRGGGDSLENARRIFQSEGRGRQEDLERLKAKGLYLDRMVQLKREQLALTGEQAERARKLNEQGLASLNERSDALLRHSQATMELTSLESERREAETAIAMIQYQDEARRSEFREQERSLTEKLETTRIRTSALSGEAVSPTGMMGGPSEPPRPPGELVVQAPCAGTVVRIAARGPGAVVASGDLLAEVACSGERLHAELQVPQTGLARLTAGQPVKLLYDAFPYQRYGVRRGTLTWASPASVAGEDAQAAPTFRAFVALDEATVTVSGQPRPLLAGMRGTARVIVGRRAVLSHAFAPLRQLRESMR